MVVLGSQCMQLDHLARVVLVEGDRTAVVVQIVQHRHMPGAGEEHLVKIAEGVRADDVAIPGMPACRDAGAELGVDVEVVVPEVDGQFEKLAPAVHGAREGRFFDLPQRTHAGVVVALAGALREHRTQRLVQRGERSRPSRQPRHESGIVDVGRIQLLVHIGLQSRIVGGSQRAEVADIIFAQNSEDLELIAENLIERSGARRLLLAPRRAKAHAVQRADGKRRDDGSGGTVPGARW